MPSESSTAPDKGKETTVTSPQANIKTTIVKTQFPSADKLPPQDTSSLNSDSQPSGSLPTASSTVGIKDNGEKVFTEAGHQKHAFDLAQQILDLFSSVTKQQDTDVEGRLPTVADLYAAVANYSIAYISNPSLMRCPAQPFHSRLSVWGEMFEVDDVPAEWHVGDWCMRVRERGWKSTCIISDRSVRLKVCSAARDTTIFLTAAFCIRESAVM